MVSHTGKKNTGTNSRSNKRNGKKRRSRRSFQTHQIQHAVSLSFVLFRLIIHERYDVLQDFFSMSER